MEEGKIRCSLCRCSLFEPNFFDKKYCKNCYHKEDKHKPKMKKEETSKKISHELTRGNTGLNSELSMTDSLLDHVSKPIKMSQDNETIEDTFDDTFEDTIDEKRDEDISESPTILDTEEQSESVEFPHLKVLTKSTPGGEDSNSNFENVGEMLKNKEKHKEEKKKSPRRGIKSLSTYTTKKGRNFIIPKDRKKAFLKKNLDMNQKEEANPLSLTGYFENVIFFFFNNKIIYKNYFFFF